MIKTYPSQYDIQEVLRAQKRGFLDVFAQKKGLILFNASKDDLIQELSTLFYELSELEEIREALFQSTVKQTLSGFNVKPQNPDFDLENLYNRLREQGQLQSKGYKLEALIKEKIEDKIHYQGEIAYTKHKPGKIEILQGEKHNTEFYFFSLPDGSWQIEVDGSSSFDGKEVLKLIKMAVKSSPVEISTLRIDDLSIKNVITFFDRLAREGFDKKSWELVDIRELTFRRRNTSTNIEDEDEDDEDALDDGIETVGVEDLGGISQAVLAGRNLREHPFVKEAENSGCIFTSMTYEYKSTKSSHFIIVKAEFKGNPKIFEVSVVTTGKVEGTTSKRKITEQTSSLYRRKIASEFWNGARNIYIDLIKIPEK